jgi:RNA polymerase sigma-70 factor (ECF subfamily)
LDAAELVKTAKQGDKESLVKLIMLEKNQYYKLAFVYMKNQEEALDALEDMIVILYENIHKLKKDESFYSWSKTILVNCCKKRLKSDKKEISYDYIENEAYEEDYSSRHDKIILEKHLSKLNEKHREVIKLRYFLDMDYQSIADMLKVPLGTVKSRISIGLEKLKESLGGEFE